MTKKILVIESEPWLADSYSKSLAGRGYEVDVASDPHDAMDKIDTSLPDVVIMNLLLNESTGMGLLHELQVYEDTGRIPIIVYSQLDNLSLEDLSYYGVKEIFDSRVVKPDDIANAVERVSS